jgi:hypothetical protein
MLKYQVSSEGKMAHSDSKGPPDIAIDGDGIESSETPNRVHNDAATDRAAFLATFSAEEDKAIMRKVDWRFLWLIGVIYLIKNVCFSKATGQRLFL